MTLTDKVAKVADTALAAYAKARADMKPSPGTTGDAGPAVLATLTDDRQAAHDAVTAWIRSYQGGFPGAGLWGGVAGLLGGLQGVAAELDADQARLADEVRAGLVALTRRLQWRTEAVGWQDYDLVLGPAGIVLALANEPGCRAESVLPTARHLAGLCDRADLARLRAGDLGPEALTWHHGRINAGLAHGVPGVAAALRAACELTGSPGEFTAPLRRACDWLVAESFMDAHGFATWGDLGQDDDLPPHDLPPHDLPPHEHPPHEHPPHEHPPSGLAAVPVMRRQAWCYGTPGVAWVLWEAGRVLGDAELQGFAASAMSGFCRAFDEDRYLYTKDDAPDGGDLAICHGAAGLLAVADAFALHAGLEAAEALSVRLEDYLLRRLDEIAALAEVSMQLQSGASGILSMLLTRRGGDRRWLGLLALR